MNTEKDFLKIAPNALNHPSEQQASDWVILKTSMDFLSQKDLLELDNKMKTQDPIKDKVILLSIDHNVTTHKTIVKYKLKRTFYSLMNMDKYFEEINQAQANLNKAMAQFINSPEHKKIVEALKKVGAFG